MSEHIDRTMVCLDYWVQVVGEHESKVAKVKEMHSDGIVTVEGEAVLWEDVMGIDLGHDWLDAAGFVQDVDGKFYLSGFGCVIWPDEEYSVYAGSIRLSGLRFVHELQHLYAGLKQRTLSIDSPPVY
jgi:hypothetical protein